MYIPVTLHAVQSSYVSSARTRLASSFRTFQVSFPEGIALSPAAIWFDSHRNRLKRLNPLHIRQSRESGTRRRLPAEPDVVPFGNIFKIPEDDERSAARTRY